MAAGGFVGWSGTPPAAPLKHRPQQHFGIAAHVGFSVGRGAGAGGSWLSHGVSWCLSVCLSVSATSSFLFPPRVAFTQGVTSAPECLSP